MQRVVAANEQYVWSCSIRALPALRGSTQRNSVAAMQVINPFFCRVDFGRKPRSAEAFATR